MEIGNRYCAIGSFICTKYDSNTFAPTRVLFREGHYYKCENENDEYLIINGVFFNKDITEIKYVYNFFYTQKELRREKLKKLGL